MSSNIEWTDSTWNPVIGCRHVAEGCTSMIEGVHRVAQLIAERVSQHDAEVNLRTEIESTAREHLRECYPLHWVIVGGESGHNARPCDIAWIRSIVEQCKAAGVPCFVKQLGAAPYEMVENYACEDDTCQRCGGRGEIVTCPDDMCYGQEECIHGDGYSTCPDCAGSGHEDTRIGEDLKLRDRKGGDPAEWPEDLRIREFPCTQ